MNSKKIRSKILTGRGHVRYLLLGILGVFFLVPGVIPFSVASATHCMPAGGTGLTAYMIIWHSHSTVTGKTINAAGCDIGIYVAPGTQDVTISGNTITGANDHAILVQDASYVQIANNFVTRNSQTGGHSCNYVPQPCISEDKAVQLAGTTNAIVVDNIVSYNFADGGIGVTSDNQTFNPAALSGSSSRPHISKDVIVAGNTVVNNLAGCGIVVATYVDNAPVVNTKVVYNTIVGNSPSDVAGGAQPYVGQIVVAADGPFASVFNTIVEHNTLAGSLLPGIVVHSNVFGDKIVNTIITGNLLADNGFYPPSFSTGPNDPGASNGPTGIALIAEVGVQPPGTPSPILAYTLVRANTFLSDTNAVWLCHTSHTFVSGISGNPTHKVVSCP